MMNIRFAIPHSNIIYVRNNYYLSILYGIMKDDDLQILNYAGKIAGDNISKLVVGLQSFGQLALLPIAAPYILTFYVLYRKIFRRKLNRLNSKVLSTEALKIDSAILEQEKRMEQLREGVELLKKDYEKNSSDDRVRLLLEERKKALDQTKTIYDDLLLRLEFVKNVKLLLERKQYLAEKGVWSSLNNVSRKNIKALDNEIKEKSVDSALMKNYLEELNQKQDFYNEIMKVE